MPVYWTSDYDRVRVMRVKQECAKVERKRREKWEATKAAMIRKRTDADRVATGGEHDG